MNWGWRGNIKLWLYSSACKLYSNKVAVLETEEQNETTLFFTENCG